MENPLVPATSQELTGQPITPDRLFDPMEWNDPGRLRIVTFDTSTDAGKELVLRAMEKPDADLALMAKETVEIENVVLFRQEGTIDNGAEVVMKTKLALILKDGTIFSFASPSAIDSFRRIVVEFGGLQNWKPGMKVKVVPVASGDQKTYYLLRRVGS